MGELVPTIIKSLLEALNFPVMLATAAASAVVVFAPGLRPAVGEVVWIISLLSFVFAVVWLIAKSVEWIFRLGISRQELRGSERTKLYFTIDSLLGTLSGITGAHYLSARGPIISAQIAVIYAQLRQLGVSTPELDPSDPTNDLDGHIAFLSSLQPFIAGAPLKALRDHAQRLRLSER